MSEVLTHESELAGLRWLQLSGSRAAVFRTLGQASASEIRSVQRAMPGQEALKRWAASASGSARVRSLIDAVERDFPEVLLEVRELAAGADIDDELLLLANLRGDVGVAYGTGCTDLAWRAERSYVAHNEDGAPALDGQFMILTLRIEDEPVVTVQWYPGFVPSNTHVVTSAGLAWGIDHIQVTRPVTAAGRHFVARGLQRAANLDAAVDYLRMHPCAGGFTYTIGEFGTGRVAIVETAAGHVDVFEPAADGTLHWHTNHLKRLSADLEATSSGASEEIRQLGDRAESVARGNLLQTLKPRTVDAGWFRRTLAEHERPRGVRRTAAGDDPLMTLMSTVVDLHDESIELHASHGSSAAINVADYLAG